MMTITQTCLPLPAAVGAPAAADTNILAALIEALDSPTRFTLVERGGELHLLPLH
jgi:hypothetical protein